MHKVILIIIVTCFTSSVFSQSDKLYEQIQFLNYSQNSPEKIKKSGIGKEIIYEYVPDKHGITDSSVRTVIYYNALGYVSEQQEFYGKSVPIETIKYTYNLTAAESIHSVIIKTIGVNGVNGITEVEYDSLGREADKFWYNADTSRMVVNHKEYNDKNQLESIFSKSNFEEFHLTTRCYYDKKGQLVKADFFFPNVKLPSSFTYQVDYLNDSVYTNSVFYSTAPYDFLDAQYIYNKSGHLIAKNRIHHNIKYSTPSYDGYYGNGASFEREIRKDLYRVETDNSQNNSLSNKNSLATLQSALSSDVKYYSGVSNEQTSDTEIYLYNNDGTIAETDVHIAGVHKLPNTMIRHYYYHN